MTSSYSQTLDRVHMRESAETFSSANSVSDSLNLVCLYVPPFQSMSAAGHSLANLRISAPALRLPLRNSHTQLGVMTATALPAFAILGSTSQRETTSTRLGAWTLRACPAPRERVRMVLNPRARVTCQRRHIKRAWTA